jgi:chemotaxis protein CheX
MSDATAPLKLPETLDTAAAPALLEALRARRGAALVLDASALRWIGGSCAQLLLAAAKAWRVDRRPLSLVDLGEEPGALLALLGIEPAQLSAD